MARAISEAALRSIGKGAHYATRLTIAHPGEEPVEFNKAPGWRVTEVGPIAGPRLGVQGMHLLPTKGISDLFEYAGLPGAVYSADIGIVLGATIEWVKVFTGKVGEGESQRLRMGAPITLTDDWSWSDRVPLPGEFVTVANVSRAATIVDLMSPPAVGFGTEVLDVGGYITTPGVYTGSRGQAVAALAVDGLVQVGFNNEGDLVIKAQPDTTYQLTPDWLFRTDQEVSLAVPVAPNYPANIVKGSLKRIRPWAESLFNAVTVKPTGSEQTWTAQTVTLSDTSDPRHPSKIGLRPFEISSDTIDNACDAWILAQRSLGRILRRTGERVQFQTLLNPAIEADDICWVGALPTIDDAGWNNNYIATSVTHSKTAGITTVEGVSARGYKLE